MSASVPSPTPDYFSSRKVSAGRIRAGATPTTPHTPLFNRSISSLYNSPGGSFRNEEENNVAIDLGARFLRIGVANEPIPRCILNFNPDEQRRLGDYRHYMPDYQRGRKRKRGQECASDWELYSNDVRQLDLGLVGDKLERACRKAESEILMLDERKKRLTLAVSNLLPRPVLDVMLAALFNVFQAPSITLLPTSIAALVGSGLRTGIVLDVGWSEAVATVIFEYREVLQRRSVRAGRLVSEGTCEMLDAVCAEQAPTAVPVTFEDAQEILTRLCWCRGSSEADVSSKMGPSDLEAVLPSNPTTPVSIPLRRLSEPAENLCSPSTELSSVPDADDTSLPQLLFHALLALPTDVRKTCMSRIIVTGGSSHIPGLKTRIMTELQNLVQKRGWDPIKNYGRVQPKTRIHAVLPERIRRVDSQDASSPDPHDPTSRPDTPTPSRPLDPATQVSVNGEGTFSSRPSTATTATIDTAPIPTHQRSQEPDPILHKIAAHQKKHSPLEPIEGELRLVETLGTWAGTSLMASLRVKGVVEIDREAFLKDGLHGAQGMMVKEGDEKDRKREARKSLGGAKAVAEKGFSLGMWT